LVLDYKTCLAFKPGRFSFLLRALLFCVQAGHAHPDVRAGIAAGYLVARIARCSEASLLHLSLVTKAEAKE
jgi:hypothetical protein